MLTFSIRDHYLRSCLPLTSITTIIDNQKNIITLVQQGTASNGGVRHEHLPEEV